MQKKTRGQPTPFHTFFSKAMDAAEISNVDMARRLGYAKPNVIAMMRNGSMKVPLNRIPALADILKMDHLALLQRALLAYAPELWDTIQAVLGDRLMTKNEERLLNLLRDSLAGTDIDLTKSDDFVMMLQSQARLALDRQIKDEFREPPKVRSGGSRIGEYNAGLAELLARQADERAEFIKKMGSGLGAAAA